MKNTLTAQETPLHKVFSDDYLFTIPPVQRPYSWTTDEAGELLDDLLNYIDHYKITESNIGDIDEPYFLGSIVLVKQDGPKAEVLDGQQRLTTLTILLAALRDHLDEDYAAEIESLILQKGSRIRGIEDTYRLELRNRDNDFFKNYIQKKDGIRKLQNATVKTDSQKMIKENALYFMERFESLDASTLKVLPGTVATLCYIVIVSTLNFDSAFRIFTVLNDRGLDLLTSDIFKARVVGEVATREQGNYTAKWEDVEVSLGRERFNKLFEHLRMILQMRKGSANLKEEYDEIFKKVTGKTFINDVLIPYSEIYLRLTDYYSYYGDKPELIKILTLLNRVDNVDWLPVAMFYIHKNGESRLEEFLVRLETLAGTSMVLRKNYNWRQGRYPQILKEIEAGQNVFSPKSALEVRESDKKDVITKLEGDVYTELKDSAKRYVLLRLDSILSNGQPHYDHSIITVEHVLPQRPAANSEWLKNFDEPEAYVHKLGNLVLLTRAKNAQARNYDFAKKKSAYFQSKSGVTSFALTTQVIGEKKWTPSVLEERQQKLIGLLKKAWKL
ncbi:DUF262 domain-containing protein [Exiguobacterium flavidum]|uniref:DUF262 domain-containing protein n=1 Tax=Exiguobacterium flavidum TaxID=2184695 RepID=UPI000DF7F496|nr:DUF262 domain-containing protein [Exiguobacterium flavidum]